MNRMNQVYFIDRDRILIYNMNMHHEQMRHLQRRFPRGDAPGSNRYDGSQIRGITSVGPCGDYPIINGY
jgi:hypothetical protein